MITSLPYDIIHEIVLNLNFPSISALRLTCKAFYSFTKMHQIWHGLVGDFRIKHETYLEGELGAYTLEELERWVFPRQRARDVWEDERVPRFGSRTAALPTSTLGICEFLPGGRWLLFSGSRNLYALDLDSGARVPQPKTLVARIQGVINYSKPWIDRSSKRLTVRVAGRVQSSVGLQVFVQEIKLVGHGADATLATSQYARFGLGGKALNEWEQTLDATTAVNDRYYVMFREGQVQNQKYEIHTYLYSGASGQEKPFTLLPIAILRLEDAGRQSAPLYVRHIHGDMFIFHSKKGLHIFEISRQETNSRAKYSIQLLQIIPSMDFQSCSSLRWTPGASKIVFLNHCCFKGIYIPHDRSTPSTLIDLGKRAPRTLATPALISLVGVSTSLFSRGHGHPLKIFPHRWSGPSLPERNGFTHKSVKADVELLRAPEKIAFNEDIGRVVLFQGGRVESQIMPALLVLDLV